MVCGCRGRLQIWPIRSKRCCLPAFGPMLPPKRDPICAALRLLYDQGAGFAAASGSFALPVVEELD